MSLRDLFRLLFKRKFQIFIFFMATFGTVASGTLLMIPTFQAKAQILVKMGRENIYSPTSGQQEFLFRYELKEQINTEIELLRSPSLATKAIKFIGPAVLCGDPYRRKEAQIDTGKGITYKVRKFVHDWKRKLLDRMGHKEQPPTVESALLIFQKQLSADWVKDSNVIEIGFKHQDPKIAARVVNKVADLYLDHHLQIYKTPQSLKFFQEQSGILKMKLELAEEGFNRLKKKHNLSSFEEQRSLLLRTASELRVDLNRTLSQEVETRNRILKLNQQITSTPETISQGQEVDHNPYLISNLQARLVELELKEKQLLTKYTEESRLVKHVREEILLVRENLTEQELKRYGKSRSGLNPTYQRLHEDILKNEADLKALNAKRETLRNQLEKYQRDLDDLNQVGVLYTQLRQEVEVNRENYRRYLAKFEESRISDAMDAKKISSVSLIEPARPPLKPVSPKKRLNILLGFFLGLVGALCLAFFSEYLNDSLERPEDVEEYLGVPVLTSIPELKKQLHWPVGRPGEIAMRMNP